MEKCVVCKKPVDGRENACDTCRTFLKWKYGKNYSKKLEEFSKLNSGGKK